jgi:hypothetical protein
MSRQTPGPWIAQDPHVVTEDGKIICDVRHAGTFNRNADLIAAAPKLLAACKAMLPIAEREEAVLASVHDNYPDELRLARERLFQLRAAIAAS